MALYARLENDVVREIISLADDVNISDCFHADIARTMVPCGSDVQEGWAYKDGGFTAPAPSLPSKDELVAYANAMQWAKAVGGYQATVNGKTVTFDTSERGYGLITGKALRLQQPKPPESVSWQVGPSTFVAISAADFMTIATEIADFIQGTFDKLNTVAIPGIETATITTLAQVDAVMA